MEYNYSYGTLTEGILNYAPIPLVIDGQNVWTNDEVIFRQAGFLPIIKTDMPQTEGYYYTERYAVEGELQVIMQYWDEHVAELEIDYASIVQDQDTYIVDLAYENVQLELGLEG